MKTTMKWIALLSAVIIFPFTSLSARADGSPSMGNYYTEWAPSAPEEATFGDTYSTELNLAPVTPEEADFTDGVPVHTETLSELAPVTPVEADFSDEAPESFTDLTALAPVTPSEADFEEETGFPADLSALAPVTPSEAYFE